MTLSIFGPGSIPAGQRPKAALEVRTVLQPHLSLARVAWLRDPERDPLAPGDLLYDPASSGAQGTGPHESTKQGPKPSVQPAENAPPSAGLYNGDKDVQELIHKYRSLSDKDKLGPEGNRIRERLLLLSRSDQVYLAPFVRDAVAAVDAEHLLRGDLRLTKVKEINDAVKRAVVEQRAEQLEQILRTLREAAAKPAASKENPVTFPRDKLPAEPDALAPLLRQMAWDKYHDNRFTVRATAPVQTLTLQGPKEIMDWAKDLIEALNRAAKGRAPGTTGP